MIVLALAGDGEGVLMEGDLDILLFHARHLGLDEDVVLVLEDIQGRVPDAEETVFATGKSREGNIKQTVHLVPEGRELVEGTPCGEFGCLIADETHKYFW